MADNKKDKNAFTQDIISMLSSSGFKVSLEKLAQSLDVSSEILEDAVSRAANTMRIDFSNIDTKMKDFNKKGISEFISAGEQKSVISAIKMRLMASYKEQLVAQGSTDIQSYLREYSKQADDAAQEIFRKINLHSESSKRIFETISNAVSTTLRPVEYFFKSIPFFGESLGHVIDSFKEKLTQSLLSKSIFQNALNTSKSVGETLSEWLIKNPFTAAIASSTVLFSFFMIKDFIKLMGITDKIANNLGITFYQSLRYTNQIFKAYTENARFGGSLHEISETFLKLSDTFASLEIPTEVLKDIEKIRIGFGLSGEEATTLFETLVKNYRIGIDNLQAQREIYVSIVAESRRLNITTQEIAKNIVNSKNAASQFLLITREQRLEFMKQVAESQKLGKTLDESKGFYSQFDKILEGVELANKLASAGTGIVLDANELFSMGLQGKFVDRYKLITGEIAKQLSLVKDQEQYQIRIRQIAGIIGKETEDITKAVEDYNRSFRGAKDNAQDFESLMKNINKSLGLEEKYNPFKQLWIDIKSLAIEVYQLFYPLFVLLMQVMRLITKTIQIVTSTIRTVLEGSGLNSIISGLTKVFSEIGSTNNEETNVSSVTPSEQNYYSNINNTFAQQQSAYNNNVNKTNQQIVSSLEQLNNTIKNQKLTFNNTTNTETKVDSKTIMREAVITSRTMPLSG